MSIYILADNQELTKLAEEVILRQDVADVMYTAKNTNELVGLLKKFEEAIVLLDYRLFDFADENQLFVTSELYPGVRWLIISEELTISLLNRLIYTSHAFSVVFKSNTLQEIKDAIKACSRNSRYVCQEAMEILLTQSQQEENTEKNPLTETEIEIVKAIAQGKTTKEIAQQRNLSIHTVTTHRKNIFRKLEVNTAYELIKYALRSGWVEPSDYYI